MTDPRPVLPASERLQITRGPAGEVLLAGEIDLGTARLLHEALESATAGADKVTVDLRKVSVIQSAGVAEFFEHAEEAYLTLVVREDTVVASVIKMCGLEIVTRVEYIPSPAPPKSL